MSQEELDKDWYTYLTEDFKLDRSAYKSNERAVFDCPKCGGTTVVRIDHVKNKINDLGKYECSKCRKRGGAAKARRKLWRKRAHEELKDAVKRTDQLPDNWFGDEWAYPDDLPDPFEK